MQPTRQRRLLFPLTSTLAPRIVHLLKESSLGILQMGDRDTLLCHEILSESGYMGKLSFLQRFSTRNLNPKVQKELSQQVEHLVVKAAKCMSLQEAGNLVLEGQKPSFAMNQPESESVSQEAGQNTH